MKESWIRWAIAAAGIITLSGNSIGATDVMSLVYGNTLIIVRPDGRETRSYFNSDHTFTGRIPAFNYLYKGNWNTDVNGNLCRWYTPPLPGQVNPECLPVAAHAIGDSWTTTGGKAISLVLGTQ